MVTAALLPMHSSRTQAEGTAPIRGSPLSCQRDRERADSCDPPVASAQESRCHSLTGRGLVLTVVKCDMIGVDYSPTGGVQDGGALQGDRSPAGGSSEYSGQILQSVIKPLVVTLQEIREYDHSTKEPYLRS